MSELKNNAVVQIEEPLQKLGKDLNFATSEAYNYLKTNLVFSIPKKENSAIVVGITSAIPQDGKSYTAINLAYSLASDGNKVLLISADMRKPSIEKSLDLTQSPGLSNILTDFKAKRRVVSALHENLFILTSGNCPPNPSKLMSSNEFEMLIEELKPNYKYILMDLPPVNSVSDPIAVSKLLDGIILICRHQHTRKKELREAVSKLRFVNANIIGIVYNGFSHASSYYYKRKKYERYAKYKKEN